MGKKSYTELVYELDALTKGNTKLSEPQRIFRIGEINKELSRFERSAGQTKFQF